MNTREAPTPSAWYLGARPSSIDTWLGRLRWLRAGIEAAVVLTAILVPQADFPLRRLAPLIAAAALIDIEMAIRSARAGKPSRVVATVGMAVDVCLLTGLLELSGGPSNPFAIIYLVLVALAAMTLGRLPTILVAVSVAGCYGVLISWHLEELVPSHHRLVDFPTHLFTMWLAIALVAELAGHFIKEASSAVARREAEIEEMRQQAVRTERLVSVTTLAAGAAHELSTPLATIAVASRELERILAAAADPAWAGDARLIRQEVDRCQAILDQMTGRAGGRAADMPELVEIPAVIGEIRGRLNAEEAGRLRLTVAEALAPVRVPRAGLVQVLLSLVKNAFDASNPANPVSLEVTQRDRVCRFIVRDEGTGMSADVLQRAGEPFFTTKDPGRGSGLGLFLARMFAERCGGRLALESGRGTTATLDVPLAADAAGTV